MTVSADQLAERLASIRAEMEQLDRDPSTVEIVAVTKSFSLDHVLAAAQSGLAAGESYAQELLSKQQELHQAAPASSTPGVEVRWHFLGAIQRRKISSLQPLVHTWHGLSRSEEAESLGQRGGARVYVQVSFSDDPGRNGCAPEEVGSVVSRSRDEGLEVAGLMTVAPLGDEDGLAFARLRQLAGQVGVDGLSMGMSGDYRAALSHGATVLRLGTALFGPRSPGPSARR